MTMSTPTVAAPSTGCQLVSLDGRTLPLTRVRLLGQAAAGLAEVVVEQTFRNPHPEALSLTYSLPLPADAAVVDFAFRIGERRIQGRVERTATARERFEEAVLEGRSAALLEQVRSSVFTQELGNIPPGAEVIAEITVECPLSWHDDGWQWRFPTVVGPRFMGSPGQTPDADRVSVQVVDGEHPVDVQVELRIADALTGPASSPSHVLAVAGDTIRLPMDARLDRDIVVCWPVAVSEPGVSLDVARPDGHDSGFGLLTLLPPSQGSSLRPVPRDLIVLLDTSGSMHGRPLDQAKAFVRGLVGGLGDQDRLELIAFSSRREPWRGAPTAMSARAKAEALRFVEKLRAGGGTHMHAAVVEALQPLRTEAQRQVVLITDGAIGFEQQVIGAIRTALPASSRVHVVGVGSAVNRSLSRPATRAGGGVEIIVGLDEALEKSMQRLLERTGQPQVVDLRIEGDAVLGVAPARLPDLFAGAPCNLHLKLRARGGTLRIVGRTAAGPWSREVRVAALHGGGRRSVATRFARERVEDLEVAFAGGDSGVDAQIEEIGLRHQIATRLTSWLAVSDRIDVDPDAAFRRETVPQALPYGVSAEGVGLRPPLGLYGAGAPMPVSALEEMLSRPRGAPRARSQAPTGGADREDRARGLIMPAPAPQERFDDATRGDFSGEAVEEPEGSPDFFDYGYDAPSEEPPTAILHLVAVRVRMRKGRAVFELVLPEDVQWDPVDVVIYLEDGSSHPARAKRPLVRSRARAGSSVRLTVVHDEGEQRITRITLVSGGRRFDLSVQGS